MYVRSVSSIQAALCHMCVDLLNAQHAISKYQDMYPAFADSREYKLLQVGLFRN